MFFELNPKGMHAVFQLRMVQTTAEAGDGNTVTEVKSILHAIDSTIKEMED
jgi:hypothetical protein